MLKSGVLSEILKADFSREDEADRKMKLLAQATESSMGREARLSPDMEKLRALRKNKLFRRIEADIKERDRRRKPGRPELYIDRDRIIAVNLGETDIRDTMMRQRICVNETNVLFKEEQTFKILVEQADHEARKGAFDKALGYLDKAVKMVPDDPESLLMRSGCLVGLQRYELALDDVNQVLRLAPPCSKAFLTKGEALYHLGNFEHSLLCFHRAMKLRRSATPATNAKAAQIGGNCNTKDEDSIRNGILRAEEAVDNALGARAEEHFKEMCSFIKHIPSNIFGMGWHELHSLNKTEKRKRRVARIQDQSDDNNNNSEADVRSKREQKYERALLGQLAKDLDYLETLATEVTLQHQQDPLNKTHIKVIKKETEEAIEFLKNRQEFWSQFKPIYSIVATKPV